jgi:hypothetical protein
LIIALNDYVTQSGDLAFGRDKWDNAWRAYQFIRSTYDANGFAQNMGVGHGWVEGGPLLPVKNEYYQAGLAVEALQALSNLAKLIGKDDVCKQLSGEFDKAKPALDQAFWSPEGKFYAFALKQDNQRQDELSVETTVPMWFGLADPEKADQTITKLSAEEHQTDWGMRIISNRSKVYDGSGYHYGSVWPLFTGWASVGEYRYHHPLPAYLNLRSNALLFSDGSLGHFSEVLSGDYYDSFSTSSPHQIWSSAMVISPILRGMLGLHVEAAKHQVNLAPHVPADWTSFRMHNIHVNGVEVDFQYSRASDSITLETRRNGNGDCWVEFSPALSLRAQVVGVEMNGRPLPFKVQGNANDQHLSVRFPVYGGPNSLVIRMRNDFGLAINSELPPLGSASRGLRVLSESWNSGRTQLSVELSGRAGAAYELGLWNPSQISSVAGATLTKSGKLAIQMPQGESEEYVPLKIEIHFAR